MKKHTVIVVLFTVFVIFCNACASQESRGGEAGPAVRAITINTFHTLTEGGSSYYLDTRNRENDGRSGIIAMPDGEQAIYMENAAFTGGAQSNPLSPAMMIAFNFPSTNVNRFTRIAIDVAFENEEVLNAITGFYPRLIGASSGGSGSARWNLSDNFRSLRESMLEDPTAFATLEVPLNSDTVFYWGDFNSRHPIFPDRTPTNVNNILSHASTVLIEFASPDNVPGRIYFRDLRFYRD